MSIFIIAEAGVNHNGDMAMARELIDAAAAAGADAVKFQTFKAASVVTAAAAKASYQKRTTARGETQLAMLERLELTRAMHEELIAYCNERGITFLSTPFDAESLAMLMELGLEIIKVPSGEITNLPYLRRVGRLGKPVILSSGMATLGEIEAALNILEQSGTPRKCITVLHCTSEYPPPMRDVNLHAMLTIREAFGVKVGYSDHTRGIEVPIAAAALGAAVIEKHFTLDHSLPGPDHKASIEPDEFKAMVTAIRNVELALGDGIKRPAPSEQKNMAVVRRSIVAARAIQAGEVFSEENITAKRPGAGISPMRWDEVVGRRAPRDFQQDEMIEL